MSMLLVLLKSKNHSSTAELHFQVLFTFTIFVSTKKHAAKGELVADFDWHLQQQFIRHKINIYQVFFSIKIKTLFPEKFMQTTLECEIQKRNTRPLLMS